MKRREKSEVLEIEKKELYPELSLKQIKDWMDGEGIFDSCLFVAKEKGGKILGFLSFEPYDFRDDKVILELSAIAIRREYQKKGVGRALIKKSLKEIKDQWLKEEGMKVVGLIIEADEKQAMAFYEKVFPKAEKRVFRNAWSVGQEMVFYFVSMFE